jgi:hypothetical protein
VVVAILKNPAKKPLFTLEERETMLREACQPYRAVEIDTFDGLSPTMRPRVAPARSCGVSATPWTSTTSCRWPDEPSPGTGD